MEMGGRSGRCLKKGTEVENRESLWRRPKTANTGCESQIVKFELKRNRERKAQEKGREELTEKKCV